MQADTGRTEAQRELETPAGGYTGDMFVGHDLWERNMGGDLGLREGEAAIFVESAWISAWDTEPIDDAAGDGDDQTGSIGERIPAMGEAVHRQLHREANQRGWENGAWGQQYGRHKPPHG